MAAKALKSYRLEGGPDRGPLLQFNIVNFEKACTVHDPERIDTYRVFWVREGRASYTVDFKVVSISDETLLFLSPGQVFNIESETIKTGYILSFVRAFYCIETLDKQVGCNGLLFNNVFDQPFVVLMPEASRQLESIVKQIVHEFEQPGLAHWEMLKTYLQLFLINATRMLKEQSWTEPVVEEEAPAQFVKAFSELVEKHFRTHHAVQDYADMMYLAPKTLSKKLKGLGQPTPLTIITERIILEAKRMLLYSDKSVQEVAYELGYEDPAYFSRLFKKATGQSPKKFKANHLAIA